MVFSYCLFFQQYITLLLEKLPRFPICNLPSVNFIKVMQMSDGLFLSPLFQKESFALYALYSKNKPQSDALFISHGQSFFKVRFHGATSVETRRKRFKVLEVE